MAVHHENMTLFKEHLQIPAYLFVLLLPSEGLFSPSLLSIPHSRHPSLAMCVWEQSANGFDLQKCWMEEHK